jgi:deoxyribodipyrimidine photo-lyase
MISVFWFRRDLRLQDNAGLYHALKEGGPVLSFFLFDQDILEPLQNKKDARVGFIHREVSRLQAELTQLGSTILVKHGRAVDTWKAILEQYPVKAVYTNRDYEPSALDRDQEVRSFLSAQGIPLYDYKDQVIFEKNEVLKDDGTPYTVFTPYSRKWHARLNSKQSAVIKNEQQEPESFYLRSYETERYFNRFYQTPALPVPSLEAIGFEPSEIPIPDTVVSRGLIKAYDKTRDIPAILGTSRLGIHFRFGTISIREKARLAKYLNATYLNELIWRDFYSQIMAHFPRVAYQSFKLPYERIPWRMEATEWEAWKAGKTGYPIVDAGMRELSATGFMHNRVRMITASFLTKHLLHDWRLGERWFAEKLLDYDLASNVGGWQWAASCGTDAVPYFRIFNPTEQTKKFDPEYRYIRKWVPEYGTAAYPRPIVEHSFARERCLNTFKKALSDV